MKYLRYRTSITIITRSGQIDLDRCANGFVLRNTSAAGDITWNNSQAIAPGQSVSVGGNYGEIIRDRISVVVPANGSAELIQKLYIGEIENFDSL